MKKMNLPFLPMIASLIFAGCSSNQSSNPSQFESQLEKSLETGLPIKAAVINFNFDSSTISPKEIHHIEAISKKFEKVPDNHILLVKGHTDRIGPEPYNEDLGLQRAVSIKEALIEKGIPSNKIRTLSYGEDMPVVLTDDWSERRRNRRAIVEIVPIKQSDSSTTVISMQKQRIKNKILH